ncbi:MAG: hypothetical protein D6720_00600 [Gammaproteobacteria bacterium]|nr:MAG: hypothetical protein D6720_00600 [Gammaproteobacteria bacterium]
MATQQIATEHLKDYFDHFSMIMPTELVEVEVAGLDLGDQIEAEWAPLTGISYDPKDDVVVVELDDGKVQHSIRSPQEVVVDEGEDGVHSISIKCGEGHLHLLRLKEPRTLPPKE